MFTGTTHMSAASEIYKIFNHWYNIIASGEPAQTAPGTSTLECLKSAAITGSAGDQSSKRIHQFSEMKLSPIWCC